MWKIATGVALGALLLAPMAAYAESDIVGSWKQTAFYQKVVATGERRDIYGDKVLGRSSTRKKERSARWQLPLTASRPHPL
jgi:hypothetical protein